MNIILEEKSKKAVCPAGNHNAICVAVYDLGMHASKNGWSEKQKLALIFETDREIESGKLAGKAYMVSKIVSVSHHPESALMKMLLSWFGCDPTENANGKRRFDIDRLVGRTCTVAVSHYSVNGETKSRITSVTPHMSNQPVIVPSFNKDDVPAWVKKMQEQRIDTSKRKAWPKEVDAAPAPEAQPQGKPQDEAPTKESQDDDDFLNL